MIFLYKWFKNLGYINQAVYQWELGDNYIQDLLSVGEELHNLIKTDKLTSDKISQSLTYIDDLQKKLTDAENQFSYNMSMVARWAANFVFIVMLVFSVVGCLICIILIRFISGIISDLNYKKIQIETQAEEEKKIKIKLEESEKRFRALADTSPLAIYMSEGIKQKATYINPTFINLFGYTIDEVPTVDHLWPLAYPDPVYRKQVADEWQRRVEQAIESKTTIEPMEVAVTCKDGSKKDISWGFITIGEQNWACGLDLTARKQAEKEKEKTINELQKSLEEIRTLRGILPICASCKKIRDDKGYWTQIESYIRDHSEANFSHSICPECKKKLYPDFEEN